MIVENGRVVEGRVRNVFPEIDRATRLGKVRIALPKEAPLRIGAFARGTVELARRTGIAVPIASVIYGTDGPAVQVVVDNKVQARRVRPGLASDGFVQVEEGVAAGDLVVAKAGSFLRDGDTAWVLRPAYNTVLKVSAAAYMSAGRSSHLLHCLVHCPDDGRQMTDPATTKKKKKPLPGAMTPTAVGRRVRLALVGLAVAAVAATTLPGQQAAADHTPLPDTVTLVGSLQSELGCPGDWQPECDATHLQPVAGEPGVFRGTFTVPTGAFEYKAAINESFDENYGAGWGPGRREHSLDGAGW